MPIKIIRQDITRVRCDAIVNPTNVYMIPGGGVDAAIHKAAGRELAEECLSVEGGCPLGEARITAAYNLPARYVIHTAGPTWEGGDSGERAILRSCYAEAMKLAIKYGCASVAFPLISSGLYGYPKDRVLKEATDVISELIGNRDIMVYIVVFDKTAYSISQELYNDVQSFIDNNYVDAHLDELDYERELVNFLEYNLGVEPLTPRERAFISSGTVPVDLGQEPPGDEDELLAMFNEELGREMFDALLVDDSGAATVNKCGAPTAPELEDMLGSMDKGFAETLFHYIDERKISDVEAYKRSNVGKKTFSKIKCNRDYRPSKETAVSFAIGLRLNIEEATHLLSTAGMCLSRSNKFDVIVEYFILSGNYESIFDVNEVLYQFDQPTLGV